MTPLDYKKWVVKNTIRDFVHDHAVEICERTGIGSTQRQMIYASRWLNWTAGCFLKHGPLLEISDSRLPVLVELWLKEALHLEDDNV